MGFHAPPMIAAATLLPAAAPDPYAPDVPEPCSVDAIARDTTDPRFLSPWVAYVPESATVPSPGRRIRENVVVLVNPVAERDGRDKVVDFYRYLKGRTDYGRLPRQSPTYWGRYVFVDINRDAHQLTMADPAVSGIALDCGDRFVYNPPVEPHGRDRPRR